MRQGNFVYIGIPLKKTTASCDQLCLLLKYCTAMGYLKAASTVPFNFPLHNFQKWDCRCRRAYSFGIGEVLQMHPIASHLVVKRNLVVKIGYVDFSNMFKDLVFGKDYLKGGKFD